MAADQYPHSIDDDPLGVATVLESDLPHVEPSLLHLLQRADRGELAADDDPQVYTRLLLLQQGIGQGGESIVVLVASEQAERLVLEQDAALGGVD